MPLDCPWRYLRLWATWNNIFSDISIRAIQCCEPPGLISSLIMSQVLPAKVRKLFWYLPLKCHRLYLRLWATWIDIFSYSTPRCYPLLLAAWFDIFSHIVPGATNDSGLPGLISFITVSKVLPMTVDYLYGYLLSHITFPRVYAWMVQNGTKRIFFDACSPKKNVFCLNECLLQGPDRNNALRVVNLRSKMGPYAFTLDVENIFVGFRKPTHFLAVSMIQKQWSWQSHH